MQLFDVLFEKILAYVLPFQPNKRNTKLNTNGVKMGENYIMHADLLNMDISEQVGRAFS